MKHLIGSLGRRHLALALGTAVIATLLGAGIATSGDGQSPQTSELLHQVRAATSVYRDVDAAVAAGYEPAGPCAEDPKYGGMGFHYVNPELSADDTFDPLRPEALVYQPRGDGTLLLGAVEYFRADADQDLATDADRPSLFELPFDRPMLGHEPGMPIHYDVHVWLFRHNPAGMFAASNPSVRCSVDTAGESR